MGTTRHPSESEETRESGVGPLTVSNDSFYRLVLVTETPSFTPDAERGSRENNTGEPKNPKEAPQLHSGLPKLTKRSDFK